MSSFLFLSCFYSPFPYEYKIRGAPPFLVREASNLATQRRRGNDHFTNGPRDNSSRFPGSSKENHFRRDIKASVRQYGPFCFPAFRERLFIKVPKGSPKGPLILSDCAQWSHSYYAHLFCYTTILFKKSGEGLKGSFDSVFYTDSDDVFRFFLIKPDFAAPFSSATVTHLGPS